MANLITNTYLENRRLPATILVAVLLCACNSSNSKPEATTSRDTNSRSVSITKDEKHRLYSAALAASESPLDTDLFKDACKKIGIFDPNGSPNDRYMSFVAEHFNWGTSAESEEFRRQVNTREKAKAYVEKHLPR